MTPDEDHEPSSTNPGQPMPIPVTYQPESEQPEPEQAATDPEPPVSDPPETEPDQEEPEQGPEMPEEQPADPAAEPPEQEPRPPVETPPAQIAPVRIDNVNQSVREYIRRHKRWQVMVFVPCMILWEVLAIVIIAKFVQKGYNNGSNGNANGKLFGGLIGFPFFLAGAEYYRIKQQFEAAFLQQFAANNGFSFNAAGQLDEAYGTIFRIAGNPTVSDIVTGNYGDSTLRLFLYELQIGKARYQDTVVELDLHGRLPNLMLIAKGSRYNQVDLAGTFKKVSGADAQVELEGDFADYFSLYSQQQNQIEAREVFTPDIMQLAVTDLKQYSIETVNNRVYIYANHFIGTTAELSDIFALAEKLIGKLSPLAGRMSEDSMVTVPPANAIKLKKHHPLLDKLLTVLMTIITVGGIGILLYIAFVAQPAATSSSAAPKPLNPTYAKYITQASDLDSESSTTNNKGPQIVTAATAALQASKNANEREYSNYWIADGLFWERQYTPAVQKVQTAIADNPKDPYPYVLQGNILVDMGQNQQALADANQALHLNANLATAYRLKAIVLANLGQKAQAIQAINQAMVLDEGPGMNQFKTADLNFYTYINNTPPPLTISP